MMLSEAGVTRMVTGNLREAHFSNKQRKIKYAGVTRDMLKKRIAWDLSRVASPEWAKYMLRQLELLDTKGRDFHNMVGQKVLVTYNEQDGDGYEVQVDYEGIVEALDPFWLIVKFELVPGSGLFDGESLPVDEEDDWEWVDERLPYLCAG